MRPAIIAASLLFSATIIVGWALAIMWLPDRAVFLVTLLAVGLLLGVTAANLWMEVT